MKISASVAVTTVITSIASMAAAQAAALPPAPPPAPPPASQPATPSPVSQPGTLPPASPPGWTYAPLPPAPPPQEPEFGDPGEYVISSTLFAEFGHLGYTKSNNSSTAFSIQPSLDYFFTKNVSIGGALYFSYSDSVGGLTDTTTTAVGIYAHAGVNVAVGSSVSWRPVLSIGYRSETSKLTPSNYYNLGSIGPQSPAYSFPERDDKLVVTEIFAPFLFHPVRHFFLGIGPDFFVDVVHITGSSSDDKRIFLGVSSIVGGWFGGERDPSGG